MKTISQAMFEAARRGAGTLAPEARDEIVGFVRSRRQADGGYVGRGGGSDLYYSSFALGVLFAMGSAGAVDAWRDDVPESPAFAGATVENLDLVHLACLLRCRLMLGAASAAPSGPGWRLAWFRKAAARTLLGAAGYDRMALALQARAWRSGRDTVYSAFLTLQAFEDLGLRAPQHDEMVPRILAAQAPCGGFADSAGAVAATTTVTAAAVVSLQQLGAPVPVTAVDWLLARQQARGGFTVAVAAAPLPDLLSTAAGLQALRAAGIAVAAPQRLAHRDFIQGLWDESGGFCGYALDDTPDVEFTFYALLALGLLE